jgi:abnormal spindle-like microcephaly-associated protein
MCVIVQCPLIEYDFRVTDLFVDLQDGVRLCRAIQLLQHDSSILTVVFFSSSSFNFFLMSLRV